MRDSTLELIEAAREVLEGYNPMTLRQCYYQLVAKQFIPNSRPSYQRLSGALVKGRQDGIIPWEWLEDRTRTPKVISMYDTLSDFTTEAKNWYHRNIWPTQPEHVIVWVEKDALSGVCWQHMGHYGIPLVVGRGYNSWSIRKDIADLIAEHENDDRPTTILYFGDFDPSGEDIVRDLRDSFEFFGVSPSVRKVALTPDQIQQWNLPPDFAKTTDARAAKFIAKYGSQSTVELDALPPKDLGTMIRQAVEEHLDMAAIRESWRITKEERVTLAKAFKETTG